MNALTVALQPAIADVPSVSLGRKRLSRSLIRWIAPRHGDPTVETLPKRCSGSKSYGLARFRPPIWVIVHVGKGRKDRMVPLAPDVAQVVRAHIVSHRLLRDDYLINSRQGESGRMTSARVWQIITSAVKAAGINKRLSPHSFRHTYAIGRLKAGASPAIVQKLLGHASLSTTQKYLDHLELADLRQWAAPLSNSAK